MVMLCVQGSESEARKRLPQGMSPPWKVILPLLIEVYLHAVYTKAMPYQILTCLIHLNSFLHARL